jgi:hypothetical protein
VKFVIISNVTIIEIVTKDGALGAVGLNMIDEGVTFKPRPSPAGGGLRKLYARNGINMGGRPLWRCGPALAGGLEFVQFFPLAIWRPV